MNGFGGGGDIAFRADITTVTTNNLQYGTAQKTKPIRVKPLQCILADQSVLATVLIDTIEGHQSLKASSMVCLGIQGEAWQQDNAKLHKAYTPIAVADDGWVTFNPKPEAVREFIEVVGDPGQKFRIYAQWGERTVVGNTIVNIQFGEAGDFILRDSSPDHGCNAEGQEDVWIVKRKVFLASYEPIASEVPLNLNN